jgi:Flp pilus assembly protein TadD
MLPDSDSQLAAALRDRYRIERELGRGGMATVYLAHDPRHDRHVALKVLHPDFAQTVGADRFLREIRLAAQLQHPHILPIFDSGSDAGRLWYAMPYVAGETLRDRLRREVQLDVEAAVRIASETADALDYAHAHGVVHRDIKPENILLTGRSPESGLPRAGGCHALVADFGIAHVADAGSGQRLTETGLVLGTPAYMSPEQAAGERAIDARSDVYALGCVLYEMLVGEPPYTGPTTQAIIARCLTNPIPSVRAARPTVPTSLEAVVSRALAKVPADRWPSAADFGRALRRAVGHEEEPSKWRAVTRSRAFRLSLVGAGLVAVVGIFATDGVIARAPRSRATPAESPTRTVASRGDPQTLALYRQGTEQMRRRTQGSLLRSIALFTEATRRDSGFALGWVGLAQALGWARTWEFDVPGVPSDSLLARRIDATERAIQLDSLDPAVWLLRSGVAAAVDPTSRDVALDAVRRALALDSLNADAWQRLGVIREELGDGDGALHALRRSVALNQGAGPGLPFLSNHFYWWRQFDSALVWARRAVATSPTFPYAWEVLGAAALESDSLDRAEAAYEAARRLDTGPTAVRALEGLAEVSVRRGDTTRARRYIVEAESLVARRRLSDHAAIAIGSAHAAAGEPSRALAWLERYRPRGDLHFQLHLRRDPQLDRLRANPRFSALIARSP